MRGLYLGYFFFLFPHILILFSCDSYSPAILLLRHFNAFRDLVSQMGSPGDQVGTNTEVASVIREFTEPVMEDEDTHYEPNSESDSVRFSAPPTHLFAHLNSEAMDFSIGNLHYI